MIQTPKHIQAKLKKAVDDAVADWDNIRFEKGVDDSIYGPIEPKFVDMNDITQEVIKEMQEMHEEWAGA